MARVSKHIIFNQPRCHLAQVGGFSSVLWRKQPRETQNAARKRTIKPSCNFSLTADDSGKAELNYTAQPGESCRGIWGILYHLHLCLIQGWTGNLSTVSTVQPVSANCGLALAVSRDFYTKSTLSLKPRSQQQLRLLNDTTLKKPSVSEIYRIDEEWKYIKYKIPKNINQISGYCLVFETTLFLRLDREWLH